MIKANFKAYNTYTVDSLHQWDINQPLEVTGLNLTTAPEVHFSNSNSDRAIVRQATLKNGVIVVNIPNSLLQEPFRIFAHIGVYEGNTFKVVEVVEIPVKPRKRPADYQLTDTDEEVYSFKRLENLLANRATTAQVANIIAHNNDTNGNSELVDVRTGADNKVYASAGEALRVQFNRSLKSKAYKVITSANYKTLLPDLDDADVNTMYNLLFASNLPEASLPANLPFSVSYGAMWLLLTMEGNTDGQYRTQVFINTGTGEMWTRYCSADWQAWHNVVGDLKASLSSYLKSEDAPITSANYEESLPDLNDAQINKVYRFLFANNLTPAEMPKNLPLKRSTGTMWTLFTIGATKDPTYATQVFINNGTGEMWTRLRGSAWQDWHKSGASEYHMTAEENLLEVLLLHQGDTIYVPAGHYDIIEMYKAYVGATYFDTYKDYTSGGSNIGRGLPVYNGTKLICSPGAFFTCHYTGNNAAVKAYFSAFATGDGFTLDGLHLETSGLRYAVHDDFNGSSKPYKSIFKNCHIRDEYRAIGGGMGTQGVYEITGCYFGNDAGSNDVAYHNNARDGRNHFTISNNYFENNLSLRHYGAATTPSDCLVSGNSFGSNIEVKFENAEYSNENINLLAWGNEIRK